ncbi:MAG: hypothetical protein U0521_19155 [Anaerolineae bacterium]
MSRLARLKHLAQLLDQPVRRRWREQVADAVPDQLIAGKSDVLDRALVGVQDDKIADFPAPRALDPHQKEMVDAAFNRIAENVVRLALLHRHQMRRMPVVLDAGVGIGDGDFFAAAPLRLSIVRRADEHAFERRSRQFVRRAADQVASRAVGKYDPFFPFKQDGRRQRVEPVEP